MNNREIKFRAWNHERQEMAYSDKDRTVWCGGKQCSVNSDHFQVSGQWIPMQFTGLLDKNGKEIYEGDILKSNSGTSGPVSFNHSSFIWKGDPLGWDMESEKPEICLPERWGQVIGNIYQNSDLL